MALVIKKGYFAAPSGTERSALVEEINCNWEVEVQESRPLDSDAVKRDGGLKNNRFSTKVVDDSDLTFTQYLFTNRGAKVTFEIRAKNAAVGVSNPKWTGSAIVPAPPVGIVNGQKLEYTVEWGVDGDVTMATA